MSLWHRNADQVTHLPFGERVPSIIMFQTISQFLLTVMTPRKDPRVCPFFPIFFFFSFSYHIYFQPLNLLPPCKRLQAKLNKFSTRRTKMARPSKHETFSAPNAASPPWIAESGSQSSTASSATSGSETLSHTTWTQPPNQSGSWTLQHTGPSVHSPANQDHGKRNSGRHISNGAPETMWVRLWRPWRRISGWAREKMWRMDWMMVKTREMREKWQRRSRSDYSRLFKLSLLHARSRLRFPRGKSAVWDLVGRARGVCRLSPAWASMRTGILRSSLRFLPK